jgi:DNA end-binding protein Ku
MAARAHWKGFLRLSLVSCPIALYPAIAAEKKISFRQVNRDTGNRLRQQLVDAVTGEVVASHSKARGYEIGENDFLLVEKDELEAVQHEARTRPFSPAVQTRTSAAPPPPTQPVKRGPALKLVEAPKVEEQAMIVPPPAPPRPIEDTRTIELDRFVRPEQVDAAYHSTPYFIVPREPIGQEVFAVIRDALAEKNLAGLGRIVLASRERPILVMPMGNGLRGITLRYAHEVREAEEYFAEIPAMKLPDEMLRITEHILDTKTEDFDPAYLEDRYRAVLVEKLREKQAKLPRRSMESEPSPQNVINLMDALKRSLAAERPVAPPVKPSPRRKAAVAKPNAAKRSPARARKAG